MHLRAAKVEDEGAPVGLLATQRIGVLIEGRAVEAAERPFVLGEVPGHPVEDHADSCLVQGVNEAAEVVGRTKPRRRREVRRHLVAPRAAERVLHDGHELDVSEAQLLDVVHEFAREVAVAEALPPRAKVHLVDAHRRLVRLVVRAVGHPRVVVPGIRGFGDDRRRLRRTFRVLRHGVGLLAPAAVLAEDLVLVRGASADAGHEQLPDARDAERAHRVGCSLPHVEVADDSNRPRIGRPHGEGGAGHVAKHRGVELHVGAEHIPQPLVAALANEVQVQLAERRQEAVRDRP